MEWSILKSFKLGHYRPKLVIVEIQELQRRYLDSKRAQVRSILMVIGGLSLAVVHCSCSTPSLCCSLSPSWS